MTSARTEFPWNVWGCDAASQGRSCVLPGATSWLSMNFLIFKVSIQNVLCVIPSGKCFTTGGLWDFAYTTE